MIYFALAVDFGVVKIGRASDPPFRLGALSRSRKLRLRIVRLLEGKHPEELAMHRKFADFQVKGGLNGKEREWFWLTHHLFGPVELPEVPVDLYLAHKRNLFFTRCQQRMNEKLGSFDRLDHS